MKALEMANNMISLLMDKIKNHQDGYYIDKFHYDQCMINEDLVIVVGSGTIIIHKNFFREGISSSSVGNININDAGTDYGWLLSVNGVIAFIDCDKDVHIWGQDMSSGKHCSLYYLENKFLNEKSKLFLNELKGDANQKEVVIKFAND